MSFESKVIVAVELFNGTDAEGNLRIDKNGKQAIMLRVIAGKAPNRNVLSGTVAENLGFAPGKMYFVQITENLPENAKTEERKAALTKAIAENGRQFTFTKLADVSPVEALQAEAVLGKPEMISIEVAVKQNSTNKVVIDAKEKI
jgi:hypothetical protein